jgi:segregation and condensation protein B
MSKVKGRRKPLHSEITSLRRSKKAVVVEAPAPEVPEADASAEAASPEIELNAEAPPESLADVAPADAPEAVEAAEPVDSHVEPSRHGESQPEKAPESALSGDEELDGLSIDMLASVDEEPELAETRDPERDSALSDAFETNEDTRVSSNVVSIDRDEPDDMEIFLSGLIEALLFTSQKPLPLKDLARSAGIDRPRARELVERLMRNYAPRGINIEEVAGGYVLRSSPRYAPQIQKFLSLRPVRLSRAQLETLAIVAYRQPVTKPEVDDIRGVDSGQVLKGLLERDLLKTLGKKDEPGRPMLYGTTNDFLELLNLRSLGELPTLREYTELSEESKRKFAEETGEEAPDELPTAEAVAEAASGAMASDAASAAEGSPTEGEPMREPRASEEAEVAAAAGEGESVASEGDSEAALAGESADGEPSLESDTLEAGQADEDEEEDADEDDDLDDDDLDEDDEDDVDEDDVDEDDVDEDDADEDDVDEDDVDEDDADEDDEDEDDDE